MLSKNLVDIRKFTVIKVIGNGGFGEVYLVENTKTHEKMAAKACLDGQTFDFDQQKVQNLTLLSKYHIRLVYPLKASVLLIFRTTTYQFYFSNTIQMDP